MQELRVSTFLFIATIAVLFHACGDKASDNAAGFDQSKPLFERLSIEESGIDFTNTITENAYYNHILVDVVFNGGGVGIVDINNDGLMDVFLAGNMVSDRLYLNKGDLQFEDITASAGIQNDTWSTAVAIADVNNDGWQDIYVGKFILEEPEKRRNALYINNGDLTFTESAARYGLDHDGHCTAANFFDYDRDGDLDLYVGIQPFVSRRTKYNPNYQYNKADFTDRLYRNEGNGQFTDVTTQAGVTTFNFTLSATVSDVNNDGWPDIYVASDYEEPDYFFVNRGNGTFTNAIHQSFRHISNFSMGVDIADFNDDGWMDIYCADMAPADNYRSKANMSGMNPEKFWGLALNGYHYQYMFNTLQISNGNGTFSEIGQLSGVSKTDWSWSTLFGDYDLDGDKDLLVTNGQPRDTRNKDYANYRKHYMDSLAAVARARGEQPSINSLLLVELAPFEKLTNYLFVNNGDLTFTDAATEWGLPEKTWTQGGAYADLDNDGDLDLIIHNMNDPTYVYRNTAADRRTGHYLRVKLNGDQGNNHLSYGAKVWVFTGDDHQVQEVSPTRGYMSSSDPVLHFGLGQRETIDRLVVQWPDGRAIEMQDVAADQLLELEQSAGERRSVQVMEPANPVFADHTQASQIPYVHQENQYDDYRDEVLLPHRMSRLGPAMATADVNGDGLTDIYLGGAAGQAGGLFLLQADQTLVPAPGNVWAADARSEDVYAHFFDADGDGDADLYVVSGGNEFAEGSTAFQDRLYANDGQGNFSKTSVLPTMPVSGGVVVSGDYDGDGDLDLFVGGRQIPNRYGFPARSFLLRNDGGRFTDATSAVAPELEQAGMVTDAAWLHLNGDDQLDLVVVGEWMPIRVFHNEGGSLSEKTEELGLLNTGGWWNRIVKADMDGDGDEDLIAGNLGLNIKFKASEEQPFSVHIKDFDENGTNDVYLGYYDSDGVKYPVRGRQCSSEQMPFIAEKFETYDKFARTPLEGILGERIEGAIYHEVQQFESAYLENRGDGSLVMHKLPNDAQRAPVFGILPRDWNGDGHADLLIAGNYYEREVETTRSDAGIGQLLLGDGKGNFEVLSPAEAGLLAYLDVRNLALLEGTAQPMVVIVNNNTGVQVYRQKT